MNSLEMSNDTPKKLQTYLQESQVLLELGHVDQAIAAIEKALAIDVNFVYGLQELATIYQQQNQLNLALSYRQQIVEVQPTSHQAYRDLSQILLAQNKVEDAILGYQKALSIPEAPDFIYLELGAIFEQSDQLAQAIALYQLAAELFPAQIEITTKLSNCIARQNQIPEPEVKPYAYFFAQGRDLVTQGLYDEAIAVYTQGNYQHANNPFSYFMLGHAYSFVDNFAQELIYYYQALDCDAKNTNLASTDANLNKAIYPKLNQNQIDNIFQKIVDATLNAQQTDDLSIVVSRAKDRINDPDFYLTNARTLLKRSEFEPAIAFLEQAHIKCHQSDIACKNQDDIQYLLASAKQAKVNHELVKNRNYKIISLGSDCLPRTVATIWGLKPRKYSGELSCPFDLALHPYTAVVEALKTNFDNYLNPTHLRAHFIEKGYDSSEKFSCIKNTYHNCTFSHERGDRFSENNFERFIQVYRRRISNFYQYLNSSPVLFLVYSDCSVDINSLVTVIAHKFPQLKFKVILILLNDNISIPTIEQESAVITYRISGFEQYRWPTLCKTRIDYERKISQSIKQVILDYF